jgi:N-acyl-D-aspartate/D-glutamate deacylase
VREQQAMPLEEAVDRLTGKTALMHDITDRGFIAAGNAPRAGSYGIHTSSLDLV